MAAKGTQIFVGDGESGSEVGGNGDSCLDGWIRGDDDGGDHGERLGCGYTILTCDCGRDDEWVREVIGAEVGICFDVMMIVLEPQWSPLARHRLEMLIQIPVMVRKTEEKVVMVKVMHLTGLTTLNWGYELEVVMNSRRIPSALLTNEDAAYNNEDDDDDSDLDDPTRLLAAASGGGSEEQLNGPSRASADVRGSSRKEKAVAIVRAVAGVGVDVGGPSLLIKYDGLNGDLWIY
ncbi:hypothetical protein BC829DRAFT_448827 [Chytridium lagenaria]|nr:hypothetical protein BC829DRAFT_448827 [Chytridium lagenaria]